MPELYWEYGYLYVWMILIGVVVGAVVLYMLIGVIPVPPVQPVVRCAPPAVAACCIMCCITSHRATLRCNVLQDCQGLRQRSQTSSPEGGSVHESEAAGN
jgi:hypothetical protein